jgi:hypothetical protein
LGDAAKTLFHEYLHWATVTGADFVPKEFRGEFKRGTEEFFRQHAWIWGESASLHRDLRGVLGDTSVSLNAGTFEKMAKYYESHTFDQFVDYVKAQGLDLY